MNTALLIQAIKEGKFYQAEKELQNYNVEDIEKALYLLAYDENNFCAYAFAEFLISKNSSELGRKIAREIAQCAFNYLSTAYATAAYHARKIYQSSLDQPTITDGGLFSLYDYPDAPLDPAEIIEVAEKILRINPNSTQAKIALSKALENTKTITHESQSNELEKLITAGKFEEAAELHTKISSKKLYQIVTYLGCEEKSLSAYAFVWYLLRENESPELHFIAYRIATQAYPSKLDGCDAVGIFHLKQALSLDPKNEKYHEHLLMLHRPAMQPSSLITDSEAIHIAQAGLTINHYNVFMQRVLKSLNHAKK